MNAPLHSLSMHANHMARHTDNERMQTILQYVGVGSVIMMGAAATVHLFRDLFKPAPEPYPRHKYREMMDELNDKGRGR
ncbi:hypothetical protein [Limnoglobus roseus]|uniref:Mitochondrial cytochrome c oxidase subunit VIc/VIIs domain-containing protein n=1 Tax=Limnoglobus roseus TaxID=2598579 RepID=A0A5C1A6E3_9BACT|nr:hypothetical protein [Limnoglobus roseus]QEL14809.1 hypothetical protein PX52LOC_01706 [Limnoglobus roseus]